MLELFWWLLVGHAAGDYALQNAFIAQGKNRNTPVDKTTKFWPHCLTAHALIHGGLVGLITGIWWLGILEAVAHWIIDFGKCENWYGLHIDQALHIGCKILWVITTLCLL